MQNLTLGALQDNKLCRICLKTSEITRPLFALDNTTGETCSETLKNCASIQLQRDNRLPSQGCLQCIEVIYKLYGFRKLCETSNEVLDEILRNSNGTKENVQNAVPEIKSEAIDQFDSIDDDEASTNEVFLCMANPDNFHMEEDDLKPTQSFAKLNSDEINLKQEELEIKNENIEEKPSEETCEEFKEGLSIPDIKVPNEASLHTLPPKSRKIYEQTYDHFCKWCMKKKVHFYTENVLLGYFTEKTKSLKASTLWAQYSMLKATLIVKNSIDISKFPRLIAYLKTTSLGYKPKKSKVLSREQIDKFLIEAPDETYLMAKIALIFGITGACRNNELVKLSIKDVQDLGSAMMITINDSKTMRNRVFTIVSREEEPIDFVALCRKYMALRKANSEHTRFFVAYKNNECSTQPVGKNLFGKIPEKIATFLELSDASLYTGHCFRRSSASLHANSGRHWRS